jgi:hypothetical protein
VVKRGRESFRNTVKREIKGIIPLKPFLVREVQILKYILFSRKIYNARLGEGERETSQEATSTCH